MPDEIIPQTKLQYRDHEIDAYKKAGYFQSSLLQQSYIQLIAPDVHYQLQELANEIAGDNGVDMEFRVHIINDKSWNTFSLGSGDIFIPLLKLEMVANRDEIAFELAREIAVQHKFLHLLDMEERYTDRERDQAIATFSGIVISSAVSSAFNHFVVVPIHKNIMEQIIDIPEVSPYLSIELQHIVMLEKSLQYGNISKNIGTVLGTLLGWAPNMISNQTYKLVVQMITVVNEDDNKSRRTRKDDWGLLYMSNAGYDPIAGHAVIEKINEFEMDIINKNKSEK